MSGRWTTRLLGVAAGLVLVPVMLAAGAAAGFVGTLRWLGDPPPEDPVAAESTPAFRIPAQE